jgi:signal recognition particle subunit SRP54
MFETTLSSRLKMALRRVTGKGVLSVEDLELALKEIRRALLEADVHLSVIKQLTETIKQEAQGEKIKKGLNPGQQVVKIVSDALTNLMGEASASMTFKPNQLTVIMMMGLQGTGKTTASAKLSHYLKTHNKKVLLIAADVQRPAAVEQLKKLGEKHQLDVFDKGLSPVLEVVKEGLEKAKSNHYDVVIIDTAGRLTIDHALMEELKAIKTLSNPTEILLTVDAMTGQDAANTASMFHEQIGATGVILTKLDGDARGGAALSVYYVSKIPIKLMSLGETIETLEVFHPDRMASRILGMGDVMTLVEKATEAIDEDDAKNLMEKIQNNTFNYDDLKKQFKMLKRMGSMKKIVGLIPGLGSKMPEVDDKPIEDMNVIIDSMTKKERKQPDLIEKSSKRRERIAKGSGKSVSDVNKLRQAFNQQVTMMKKMMTMDESSLKNMKPQHMMQQKIKKGKGKNKGRFRY